MCQFVPNSLSCVSAEYYLNWLTVGKVMTDIKKVNFLLRQCTYASLYRQKQVVKKQIHNYTAKESNTIGELPKLCVKIRPDS